MTASFVLSPLSPSQADSIANRRCPFAFWSRTGIPVRCADVPTRRRRRTPLRRPPPHALLDPAVACVLSHTEASAFLALRSLAPRGSAETKISATSVLNEARGHATHGMQLSAAHSRSDGNALSAIELSGRWSVNLGRDTVPGVKLHEGGVELVVPSPTTVPEASGSVVREAPTIGNAMLTFAHLAKMAKKRRVGAYECFFDPDSPPQKIAAISEQTDRTASLQPHVHGKPPTVILGGFGMHRFKGGTDPAADTRTKVQALGSYATRGHVLDVCTGLGYTAIDLARQPGVTSVTTIELDPVMVDMQRRNPWSEDLFVNSKIHRLVANAVLALPELPSRTFNAIVHDPPAQAMAGELYAQTFYEQLARVLAPGGKLFHYIGDPSSMESGRHYKGVIQRLHVAGFTSIQQAPSAFGVTARVRSG